MADPPPTEKANFIREFDCLVIPPLDCTFFSLHITSTYQENVKDFPMEFQNVNFTIDDIILDESFNDVSPNPFNDDAFKNPSCLPDCLELKPELKSQALATAPKSSKKVEKKKSEVKTKKVASV
ncbi:hypothetical protein MTR67_018935 [Solanum verrucosum]|uniref:Uncharacterized protein n=1 Tax=Solanum verrucosum TaxID=315347 RepID=A0AAF0QN83_SOLVR|nr:hypothetical protein MTR67_018935 [Solanum verrucosum]